MTLTRGEGAEVTRAAAAAGRAVREMPCAYRRRALLLGDGLPSTMHGTFSGGGGGGTPGMRGEGEGHVPWPPQSECTYLRAGTMANSGVGVIVRRGWQAHCTLPRRTSRRQQTRRKLKQLFVRCAVCWTKQLHTRRQ